MRAVVIIMDGAGVGHAPDAQDYGDFGASTLQHIAQKLEGLFWRNLWQLGIANIKPIEGMTRNFNAIGAWGSMAEKSMGKDSTSGHWELAGLIVEKPFPLFPDGFPPAIIGPFEKAIGCKILWNKPASGTEIIAKLGDEHVKTGSPIVYTSADSVFQIAAHEKIIPLEKLYEWCKIAREILKDEFAVGRVIARPFIGENGKYERTAGRHDFSLLPYDKTLLDLVKDAGQPVVAIGKIFDLYAGQGITEHHPVCSNTEGIAKTIELIKRRQDGLLMNNLVDFDMKYGHRRDVIGFARAIREFDNALPAIMENLAENDILFITADHGNDPTHCGTDHTRELVPLLVYGKKVKPVEIGDRKTFADFGATIAEILRTKPTKHGKSFAEKIF